MIKISYKREKYLVLVLILVIILFSILFISFVNTNPSFSQGERKDFFLILIETLIGVFIGIIVGGYAYKHRRNIREKLKLLPFNDGLKKEIESLKAVSSC